jgi:hypothetical protein
MADPNPTFLMPVTGISLIASEGATGIPKSAAALAGESIAVAPICTSVEAKMAEKDANIFCRVMNAITNTEEIMGG